MWSQLKSYDTISLKPHANFSQFESRRDVDEVDAVRGESVGVQSKEAN